MKTKYDKIGLGYAGQRKTDTRIQEQIEAQLESAQRILNIGAGTGSYEPKGGDLIAVEPSHAMIAQRVIDAHPVVQAYAEDLPFEDKSFSHTMTVLSMHHWTDRDKAFKEINRVTREKFVAVSWNPAKGLFWLTRDYFPEIHDMDKHIFPGKEELEKYFDKVSMTPILIPEDCQDGFLETT